MKTRATENETENELNQGRVYYYVRQHNSLLFPTLWFANKSASIGVNFLSFFGAVGGKK